MVGRPFPTEAPFGSWSLSGSPTLGELLPVWVDTRLSSWSGIGARRAGYIERFYNQRRRHAACPTAQLALGIKAADGITTGAAALPILVTRPGTARGALDPGPVAAPLNWPDLDVDKQFRLDGVSLARREAADDRKSVLLREAYGGRRQRDPDAWRDVPLGDSCGEYNRDRRNARRLPMVIELAECGAADICRYSPGRRRPSRPCPFALPIKMWWA